MKKEDFLKLGFTDEQATKAAEASAEELKSYIPKARFDEVNEAKKQVEKDRDAQLEALKKVDAAGLQAQIEKLQGENKTAKEKFDADMRKMQIERNVDMALLNAKAKNIKAVKALLEMDKIQLEGETVKGLNEQLEGLIKGDDSKFLFGESQSTSMQGFVPGEKKDGTPGAEQSKTLAESLKAYYAKT